MNDVIVRMIDFGDYLFNRNVIKDDFLEQGEYEKALMRIDKLEKQLEKEKKEKELIMLSRDRYLENCKKKSKENKELKKRIEELENGTGSV